MIKSHKERNHSISYLISQRLSIKTDLRKKEEYYIVNHKKEEYHIVNHTAKYHCCRETVGSSIRSLELRNFLSEIPKLTRVVRRFLECAVVGASRFDDEAQYAQLLGDEGRLGQDARHSQFVNDEGKFETAGRRNGGVGG